MPCAPSLVLISGIVQDSSVCDVTALFVRFCCMFIYFALPTVRLSSSPLQPTRIHSTPGGKKRKKKKSFSGVNSRPPQQSVMVKRNEDNRCRSGSRMRE